MSENTAPGTTIGAVLGTTAGASLTLVGNAGGRFALSGGTVVAGLVPTDYETATSHTLTLRETMPGSPNSPRDTVLTVAVTNVVEVTLAALGLSAASVIENSAPGAVVGAVLNKTAGSTLTLTATAGGRFALSGTNLVTGTSATDFETAASHSITVSETHPDAANSGRATTLTIAVVNAFEQPNLSAVSLSATTFMAGTAAAGAIVGATAGSTIAAAGLPAGLTINGPARTWAWTGNGTPGPVTLSLTETLGDSANSPRVSTVSVAISGRTAPGYLATTVTPYAAYGAQRVVSGYAGPLFRARRSSDAVEIDVAAQSGGDYPDYTALATWAGGSALTVPTIYDQSGNGRHLTQATVANQPSLNLASKTGNVAPVVFDGIPSTEAGTNAKSMTASGLGLDLIATSVFGAFAPIMTQNKSTFVDFEAADAATSALLLANTGEAINLQAGGTQFLSLVASADAAPAAQLTTLGGSMSATQAQVWANGVLRQIATTRTTTAMPVMRVGAYPTQANQNGRFKLFALAVYNSTVSSANGSAILSSLDTATGVPQAFDYNAVFAGDSIMQGGTYSPYLRNIPNLMVFTHGARIFNTAIYGQTLASDYTNRTSRFPGTYSSARPSVIFVQAGINDIATGAAGATLYSGTTSPLITYLKGLGYKVIVCTILPWNSTSYTTAREAERIAYNSAVVGNAGAADLVLDLAADPAMGPLSAPNNTALYNTDKLHPVNGGYAVLAPLFQAALRTVLRTTALGAGYVP